MLLFLLGFLILGVKPVLAASEVEVNNKFGIHLAVPSEEDLRAAADLVNSSGGDWGYVTLVLEEKDRQREKWQRVFDQMREFHLIPIIRLATSFENGSWRRPDPQDAKGWADFLDSLNWVVKNRYLVLFNEPNRADEWGGRVDPENYARVSLEFAKILKEKNPNFFVMLAGFDAAAPQEPPKYEDEALFLEKMLRSLPSKEEELWSYLDGWASHSYPNHGFVGSPWAQGRSSVRNYIWELNLLNNLGMKKNWPVFITETGWPHAEGKSYTRSYYSQNQVAENFRVYFGWLINDPKVQAVTPFILNYQDDPFDHFSWRRIGSNAFYPQYQTLFSLSKTSGKPKQEQRLQLSNRLPAKLITSSTYQIPLTVQNNGQAIWSQKEGYLIKLIESKGEVFDYLVSDFSQLKPFNEETLWLYFKTGEKLGNFNLSLLVAKDGEPASNSFTWRLEIIPAVDIDFKIDLFPKIKTTADDFEMIIYNEKEEPVFQKSAVKVEESRGKLGEVKNLTIGEKYRIVILKPYYLPRQSFLTVQEKNNEVFLKPMLPFDFTLDGQFSSEDLLFLLENPRLLRLLWVN